MRRDKQKIFRFSFAILISLGFIFYQATVWSQVYAQATNTPTVTETRFKISGVGDGGFCGPDLAKLYMSLQYQVIRATQRVKGTFCGRLVIIQEYKTKKDYLGFVPCNRAGGPYIFDTRPKELLGYYQLINVKFKNGKTIKSEEFGEISKYIHTFETYYPLDQCGNCGSISVQIAPPQFIFPGQAPSATPVPPQAGYQMRSNKLMGLVPGFSSQDMEFVFPTSSPQSYRENKISTATSGLALSVENLVPDRSKEYTATGIPSTATPSPTLRSTPTAATQKIASSLGKIKPPTDKPLLSALGYSIVTILAIPLIVFLIIWRRSKLV